MTTQQKKYEAAKGEFMKWMNGHKSHRAFVPANPKERSALADRCGRMHAEKNKSDPFASARARNAVMQGILDLEDFSVAGGCSV